MGQEFSDQNKVVFHHYTSEKSAVAIKASRRIEPSVSGKGDTCYGEGTYGTPLGPENGRKALAKNNYGPAWKYYENNLKRLEVVIRIVLDAKDVEHIVDEGRQIYRYNGTIYLDEADEVDFIYRTEDGTYIVDKFK